VTASVVAALRALADAFERELGKGEQTAGLYDGAHNPIGQARAFKRWCREHGVMLRRLGRRDVAVAAEVDRVILALKPREHEAGDAFARATAPRRLRAVSVGGSR
jgi:hypothetical protein